MVKLSMVDEYHSLFNKPPPPAAFQLLSDLHLEVCSQYLTFEILPSAPYLILAGDIGCLVDYDSYLAFLAKQTAQFEKVFLILGNHEFYHLSFTAALEQARRLEIEAILDGKLVLCHQKRWDIEIGNSQISILGCTLWSKIIDGARDAVQARVKDFGKINSWSIDDHNAAHASDLEWLSGQVTDIQNQNRSRAMGEPERKILIITHHAPLIHGTSNPKNINNPWSSAFATDLLEGSGLNWGDVKVWVFGHTHFTTDFEKNGTRVLSNQRGYILPGSIENKDDKYKDIVFEPKRVFSV
ncbi:Ser/Thr protein phosphatase superfamily protein [Sclerotinia borealis F-4128]|uniref:Ser/Thr protein phosphatase superfamily protein n=1 Tax=Sclerotinia borealis (strain F-4128) TaxID=1432307 RepID=W9CKT1_SCLBF|nr:Ser/Thr protein phosphatase superfamily protein [Sclerotinia borealis F-4128]